MEMTPLLVNVAWIAGAVLAAGMLLSFVRLVQGPTLADRVVAADALATMAIGALVIIAVITGQGLLLDIALAIALVVFLGTIAMAMTIERGIFK
ncbi:MAG: monovalent cation/H+ antiporter complex subunit F [Chthoniobacterales bacterium]|jgi:multicomponent Na+:H+ antiporter subunit F